MKTENKGNYHHCDAFIGVHEGKLIYVLIKDRAAFDAIDLPATEHDNGCISKGMETEALHLVFQFWEKKEERTGRA